MRDPPPLADTLGVADGDVVRVTSRRGSMTLPASVVATIRPDTVFIPYHWAGRQAANQLTNRALDPLSKIPEYKVCAVRVERVGPAGSVPVDDRDMALHGGSDARGDKPRIPPSEPGEGGG